MTSDPEVRIRRANPRDAGRIAELVRSLSRESIVSRFMGGIAREGASLELRREIQEVAGDLALIAEKPSGEIVGEAYAAMLTAHEAEAAFVVRDRDQHRGIGTALFDALVVELRSRGVRTLHADTMADNRAMLALLHDPRYPSRQQSRDGTVHVTLRIGY